MAPKETAYYDLLSVSPTATSAEIRKAFRVKALKNHPDRAGNTKEATAAFQHLRAVYNVLIDPDRRETYDQLGDTGTLHGDDDHIDVASAASFFSRARNSVTKEDIQAYESSYRDGPDELEDLIAYFERFDGNVRLACDYIPYSDDSDLTRFVAIWDAKIEDGSLPSSAAWVKARKALLKKGKGKERCMNESGPNDDGISEAPATGKRKRKTAKKAQKADSDQTDLIAQIRARANRDKGQFDDWADGLAARAEERLKSKSKSKGKKSRTKSSGADLDIDGVSSRGKNRGINKRHKS